jgi:metal transporter CNNM
MHLLIISLLVILCLFLGAAFSGLNIGLLAIRPTDLKRKARHGDVIAEKVYKYRKNGNYLIVCLLLGNVAVISILTLLLDSQAGGLIAGLLTTGLITIFAEILPQALFSRKGYALSRYFFWLLDIVFVVLYPIAKPLSMLLNRFFGEELPTIFSREEITHLVEEHAHTKGSTIDIDESRIVSGALAYSRVSAQEAMTKMADTVTVTLDDDVDASLLIKLKNSGHSRFPVFDSHTGHYVGILYMKDLLGEHIPQPVTRLYRDNIYDISDDSPLDTVLSRFIQTKSHLFLVVADDDVAIGIITLEDVIEEILNREIIDEFEPES